MAFRQSYQNKVRMRLDHILYGLEEELKKRKIKKALESAVAFGWWLNELKDERSFNTFRKMFNNVLKGKSTAHKRK